MSSFSPSPSAQRLSVAQPSELRAIETAGLVEGERCYAASTDEVFGLHKLSALPDDASTVFYTLNSRAGVGPGRWVIVPGGSGSGIIVPQRRDHSVNGASAENWRNPSPILRTNTDNNPAGSFTGGGLGNKAILGHFLAASMLLSAIASIEWEQESLTPEAVGPNTTPYGNLIVELDPIGAPGVYSILVFGDASSPLNLGTYTTPAPGVTKVVWTPATNFANVVVDKGMAILPNPPGPVFVPVAQGPAQSVPGAWPGHAYRVSDILAVYPGARVVNANPADGGMPAATIVAGILLALGDSNNKIQNAVQIRNWKLNGVAI